MNPWPALHLLILFLITKSKAKNFQKRLRKPALSSNNGTPLHSFDFRHPYFVPPKSFVDPGVATTESINVVPGQGKRTPFGFERAACSDNVTFEEPFRGRNRQDNIRYVKPGTLVISRTCIAPMQPCYGICARNGGDARCKQQYGYIMVPVVKSVYGSHIEYEYDFIKYNMACSCAIREPGS